MSSGNSSHNNNSHRGGGRDAEFRDDRDRDDRRGGRRIEGGGEGDDGMGGFNALPSRHGNPSHHHSNNSNNRSPQGGGGGSVRRTLRDVVGSSASPTSSSHPTNISSSRATRSGEPTTSISTHHRQPNHSNNNATSHSGRSGEEEQHRTVRRYGGSTSTGDHHDDLANPAVARALGQLAGGRGGGMIPSYQQHSQAGKSALPEPTLPHRQNLLLLTNVDECVQDVHLWNVMASFGVIPVRTTRSSEAFAAPNGGLQVPSCLERRIEDRQILRDMLVAEGIAKRKEERKQKAVMEAAAAVAAALSAEAAAVSAAVAPQTTTTATSAAAAEDLFVEDSANAVVMSDVGSSEGVGPADVVKEDAGNNNAKEEGSPQHHQQHGVISSESNGAKVGGSNVSDEGKGLGAEVAGGDVEEEGEDEAFSTQATFTVTLSETERQLIRRHEAAIVQNWGQPLPDPRLFTSDCNSLELSSVGSTNVLSSTMDVARGLLEGGHGGGSSYQTNNIQSNSNTSTNLLMRRAQQLSESERVVLVQLRRPADLVEAITHLNGAVLNGRRVSASLLGY